MVTATKEDTNEAEFYKSEEDSVVTMVIKHGPRLEQVLQDVFSLHRHAGGPGCCFSRYKVGEFKA
jgi:hypothetical protein